MVQINKLCLEHRERDREARWMLKHGGGRGREKQEALCRAQAPEELGGASYCHPPFILLFASPGLICQKVSVHFYAINNSPAKLLLIGLGFLS